MLYEVITLSQDNNSEGLRKYDEILKQNTKPYFLWKLEFAKIFRENGGFDVVIGNPPYIGEEGHKELFRQISITAFVITSYSIHYTKLYEGVRVFIDWLRSGKIEMRMYTEAPIHAKVYIMRKDPTKDPEHFGSVITGSST